MKYVYPAIFTPADEGGYNVAFPDFLGAVTYGLSLEDALEMAEDLLNLWLVDAEEHNEEIAKPNTAQIPADANVHMISADTIAYREVLATLEF